MSWGLILSIVLAAGFGIATIALTIRYVKKKKPVWGYDVREIIGLGSEAPPEVKLTFNDRQVKDVYRTVVIFFNKGNESIRKQDVVKSIVVDFGDGKILKEPTLLSISKKETNFYVNKVGDNSIELGFNYLGHSDGACIEVMHTEGSSPSISGTIIDTPISEIGGFAECTRSPSIIRTAVYGVVLVGVTIYFGLTIHSFFSNIVEPIVTSRLFLMSIAGTAMVFLAAFLYVDIPLIIRNRRFPSWCRDISEMIVEAKLTELGKPIFGYCMKCHRRTEMAEIKVIRLADGRKAIRGICPKCKGKVFRIGDLPQNTGLL